MTCSKANFTYWVRIPTGTKDFCPVQNVQGPKQPPIQWAPVVNQLGHEFKHSSLSNAEVKHEWSYTSPPIRLHGVDRENFTFVSITVVVVDDDDDDDDSSNN